jgi:hypothetical protein
MLDHEYQSLLAQIAEADPREPLVRIYHWVRNIPYGSTGIREPREVVAHNFGSCSGKHLLLRGLLRTAGYPAEIITMFTYFNEGVPVHQSFPDELKKICREKRVPDFHHYVLVDAGRGLKIKLDATWQDALIPYGFPVNNEWTGSEDSRLAATPIREYPPVEDLIPFKMELINSLELTDRELRARFFALVTGWMATL